MQTYVRLYITVLRREEVQTIVVQGLTAATFFEQVRSMTQDEGEVWYLLNNQNNTIGLIKVKTSWYTVLRALREKAVYCFTSAKKKSDWSLQDRIKSTHKRFREIQSWLKFSNNYLHQWQVSSVGSFSILYGRFYSVSVSTSLLSVSQFVLIAPSHSFYL